MHKSARNLLSAIALSLLWAPAALALPIPAPPDFPSHSYVLMAYQSGQLLAAHNADKPVEPASITKIMTAYIVFDEIRNGRISLDDTVTVSEKAWRMGGSTMFLEVGDEVTVHQLLHGMITESGNDAALTLAEYVAGTGDAFAQYMNQYADWMGLEHSHFQNPTGMPGQNHVMSAHDMAILTKHLIQDFPELYGEYFSQKKFTYNGITQYNRNSLLWTDRSVDGVKTGHTESAGYGLVASAERNGMRLISAVTGTGSNNARTSASQALLNYGFRFFETYKTFDAGETIAKATIWKGTSNQLPLVATDAVYVTAPRDSKDALTTKIKLPTRLFAPVKQGEKIGTLQIMYKGKMLKQTPLYAATTVPVDGIVGRLIDELWLLFK